jgi:hypothetical protein
MNNLFGQNINYYEFATNINAGEETNETEKTLIT